MKSVVFLGLIASVLPFAAAQQTAWGQCGGIGWSQYSKPNVMILGLKTDMIVQLARLLAPRARAARFSTPVR